MKLNGTSKKIHIIVLKTLLCKFVRFVRYDMMFLFVSFCLVKIYINVSLSFFNVINYMFGIFCRFLSICYCSSSIGIFYSRFVYICIIVSLKNQWGFIIWSLCYFLLFLSIIFLSWYVNNYSSHTWAGTVKYLKSII